MQYVCIVNNTLLQRKDWVAKAYINHRLLKKYFKCYRAPDINLNKNLSAIGLLLNLYNVILDALFKTDAIR